MFSLNQREAIGHCKAVLSRIEIAILDGDESFFLEFVQHFLFFGEEIVVILVLKILEENPLFRPET